jgi:hypothetical protein
MRIFGVHVNVALVIVASIVLVGWLATAAPLALMLIAAMLVLACPLVMLWFLRCLRHLPEIPPVQKPDRADAKGAGSTAGGSSGVGGGNRRAVLERRRGELERRLTEFAWRRAGESDRS